MQFQEAIEKINARRAVAGVIGLGYVGLPLMLAATNQHFRVIGFDVDDQRVQSLNRGESPLQHIPADMIRAVRQSNAFEATSDFSRLREPDAILICVPTPLTKHREPDLSLVERTAEMISQTLRAGQLIILESTSYPGTTREVVKPILERSGLRSGKDFLLAFSPEREDPGNTAFSTSTIPKVVGADGSEALAAATAFYSALVTKVVPVSSMDTAEAVKIMENVFRAVNIALVNELKIIYSKMGIDIFEVIDAAKTKPFGFMPFYPGPGLGGHCIPIDPFYLTWKAREHGINTRFIELAGEINSDMPRYVVEQLGKALDRHYGIGFSQARILVVGAAYKKNVDDMRESPALVIIEALQARGAKVDYYDPHVVVIPRTRKHATLTGKRSIHFDADLIRSYEAVLIVTDHDTVDWKCLLDTARLVVDTRNVMNRVIGGEQRSKILLA